MKIIILLTLLYSIYTQACTSSNNLLGNATGFGILANAINVVATTTVNGNVGSNSAPTVIGFFTVNGNQYTGNSIVTSALNSAKTALITIGILLLNIKVVLYVEQQ